MRRGEAVNRCMVLFISRSSGVLSCGNARIPTLLVFLCLALSNFTNHIRVDVAAADTEVAAEADSTAERILAWRGEGHYSRALTLARALLDSLGREPQVRHWQVADAERLVSTLAEVVVLPEQARQEMAAADAAPAQIEVMLEAGNVVSAADLAAQHVATLGQYLGPDHPESADGMIRLAGCRLRQNDLVAAENLVREALQHHRAALGELHPVVADDLKELARLQYRKGSYRDAEPLLREALSIARQTLGDVHLDTAKYLYDLAAVLMGQGDFAAAEPLFRQSLVLHRQLLGEEHPKVAHNLNALGVLLKRKGDLEAAESIYRKTLAMRRRLLPPDHSDIAWSLSNLAGLLCDREEYAAAEPILRQAVAMQERLQGEQGEDLDMARLLHNLAYAVQLQEKYQEAEEIYREALAMTQRLLGEDNQHTAGIQHSLAVVLTHLERLDEAEDLLQRALATYRHLLGERHPYVAWALASYAFCLQVRGEHCQAGERLLEATAIFETARLRAGRGFARSLFQDSPYSQLAAVLLLQGEEEEAWPAAERALGRSLFDLLLAAGQRSLSSAEKAREDSLQNVLSQFETQLATLQMEARRDSSAATRHRFQDVRNHLLDTEAQWSAFEEEIAARYPVTEGRAYPLPRVQTALDGKTALVGWLNVETDLQQFSSWGYVIRNSGRVHWVSLTPSFSDVPEMTPADRTSDFRAMLETAGAWPFRVTAMARITGEAKLLWRQWLAPLLPFLEGVENLVVIPSSFLLGVPVEAFVDEAGTYVGDRFAVSYSPSATLHAWLQEKCDGTRKPANPQALLVGDPPFCTAHSVAMARKEGSAKNPGGGGGGQEAEPYRQLHNLRSAPRKAEPLNGLPRLPWTREEVQRVAASLPGATILLGAAATEQEMTRMATTGALRNYDYIHLATHALVDDQSPERSALILSRVDLPDPLEAAMTGAPIYDGLLTLQEIVHQWQLDADLVVLSSCRTALGREAGGEGYIGLVHAFLQVGARSMLVSLWQVEDEATALLMGRFYENLTGHVEDERDERGGLSQSKANALREAKSWLRSYRDRSGRQLFRHPAYWSGFVLIGAPR